MDADDKRIHDILGNDDYERTEKNANRYRSHLLKELALPIVVTGREDFQWEEPYLFGGWDKLEYKELKKTRPSYTDSFELQALGTPDQFDDVTAKIRRTSDGKVFEIGLSWLTCEDKDADAFELLDDYATWHTNY